MLIVKSEELIVVLFALTIKSPEIVVGPSNKRVPVPVKLDVFKYDRAVNDSTSKFESKLT